MIISDHQAPLIDRSWPREYWMDRVSVWRAVASSSRLMAGRVAAETN